MCWEKPRSNPVCCMTLNCLVVFFRVIRQVSICTAVHGGLCINKLNNPVPEKRVADHCCCCCCAQQYRSIVVGHSICPKKKQEHFPKFFPLTAAVMSVSYNVEQKEEDISRMIDGKLWNASVFTCAIMTKQKGRTAWYLNFGEPFLGLYNFDHFFFSAQHIKRGTVFRFSPSFSLFFDKNLSWHPQRSRHRTNLKKHTASKSYSDALALVIVGWCLRAASIWLAILGMCFFNVLSSVLCW